MAEYVRRVGRVARYLLDEEPVAAWAGICLLALVWFGIAVVSPAAGGVIFIGVLVVAVVVSVPVVVRAVARATRAVGEADHG